MSLCNYSSVILFKIVMYALLIKIQDADFEIGYDCFLILIYVKIIG